MQVQPSCLPLLLEADLQTERSSGTFFLTLNLQRYDPDAHIDLDFGSLGPVYITKITGPSRTEVARPFPTMESLLAIPTDGVSLTLPPASISHAYTGLVTARKSGVVQIHGSFQAMRHWPPTISCRRASGPSSNLAMQRDTSGRAPLQLRGSDLDTGWPPAPPLPPRPPPPPPPYPPPPPAPCFLEPTYKVVEKWARNRCSSAGDEACGAISKFEAYLRIKHWVPSQSVFLDFGRYGMAW